MIVEQDLRLVNFLVYIFLDRIHLNTGTYGNFEIMPLICPGGFYSCPTTLLARERYRKNYTDGMFIQLLSVCFGHLNMNICGV
jgi:hypothetical protein